MIVLHKTIPMYKQETEIKRETEASLRKQAHEYEMSYIHYEYCTIINVVIIVVAAQFI